jgi:hypothetical protein
LPHEPARGDRDHAGPAGELHTHVTRFCAPALPFGVGARRRRTTPCPRSGGRSPRSRTGSPSWSWLARFSSNTLRACNPTLSARLAPCNAGREERRRTTLSYLEDTQVSRSGASAVARALHLPRAANGGVAHGGGGWPELAILSPPPPLRLLPTPANHHPALVCVPNTCSSPSSALTPATAGAHARPSGRRKVPHFLFVLGRAGLAKCSTRNRAHGPWRRQRWGCKRGRGWLAVEQQQRRGQGRGTSRGGATDNHPFYYAGSALARSP